MRYTIQFGSTVGSFFVQSSCDLHCALAEAAEMAETLLYEKRNDGDPRQSYVVAVLEENEELECLEPAYAVVYFHSGELAIVDRDGYIDLELGELISRMR